MAKGLKVEVVWSAKHPEAPGERSGYTFIAETRHHGEALVKAWRKAGHKVTVTDV